MMRSVFAIAAFCLSLLHGLSTLRADDAPPAVDQYGGLLAVRGTPAKMFHLEKINNRWWFVTPDGHGMFVRAVSKVSSMSNMDWGGSGGFISYDAVYLEAADGRFSANLRDETESTLPNDVLFPGADYTLKSVGDAIYLGSERQRPNFTYFWMGRLGQGGRVQWHYSTAGGFKPINDTGDPAKGKALAGGGFNLDCGKYIAPPETGTGKSSDPNANKITWWDLARNGFPADFAPAAVGADKTRRYWIKGVVTKAFEVAPVLSQSFERAEMDDTVQRKYGPGADYNLKWGEAINDRFKNWGLNAAGMYSYRYAEVAPQLKKRMPTEVSWQLSGKAMKKEYAVKNVYAGFEFPPASGKYGFSAKHADPFDANYHKAMMETAAKLLPSLDGWAWCLMPEEADWLFGFNYDTHSHMGYVTLAQNPYRAVDPVSKVEHPDPKFYAKYALRDMLRIKYQGAEESLPAITGDSPVPLLKYAARPAGAELKALERLNEAWGTKYTTWETSAGNLAGGSNAWGKGSGFMDENGASVVDPNSRLPIYKEQFTRAAFPAVRKDLDEFVALATTRYGIILKAACGQGPTPPLLMPLYRGVDICFRALEPYVDGFWSRPRDARDAADMYRHCRRPIVVADYTRGDPDSPNYFNTRIEKIHFDAAKGNTVIYMPDLKYIYRSLWFVHFPEAEELNKTGKIGSKHMAARPRLEKVRWNTVEIKGDYTGAVKPGMHMELLGIYMAPGRALPPRTQAERAKVMIDVINSTLMARGDDGVQFVAGWEHWCLYDDGALNWGEIVGIGLATIHDNAYDGVEARRAVGKDARGYIIGGEERDYGNLIGPLSECLRDIDRKLVEGK